MGVDEEARALRMKTNVADRVLLRKILQTEAPTKLITATVEVLVVVYRSRFQVPEVRMV